MTDELRGHRRRTVVRSGARGTAAAGAPASAAPRVRPPRTIVRTATVAGTGAYPELPFPVPRGVQRLDVAMTPSSSQAALGIGLFDPAGAGYQSGGFRGIYGAERSSFHVSPSGASEGFVPGPIPAGTWTVLLPVFRAPAPTRVTVTITLSFEDPGQPFEPGPQPGVVVDAAGWYRGDLHCHTTASSDAWSSGSAMAPAQWAEACRRSGLDYAALTDHNVISQNYFLARDAGADVLLLAGEEMTNWVHGHATVSGMEVGEWLDFRQAPLGRPLPPGGARIREFLARAEAMGAYVAAAHPMAAHLSWRFAADGAVDPRSRTPGYEVWTGPWRAAAEAALAAWDGLLRRGRRTVANGGSDLHGVANPEGHAVGTPTTVVFAQRLARTEVVAALRAGRSFVTRSPRGAEVYLTALRPGQETDVGGAVYGAVGDRVTVRARVRRAGGMRLTFIAPGTPLGAVTLGSDDQVVEAAVPIPPGGGYVRAEVRGRPRPETGAPEMEAFTNPIFLVVGAPPGGATAETAPVPGRIGPRRRG